MEKSPNDFVPARHALSYAISGEWVKMISGNGNCKRLIETSIGRRSCAAAHKERNGIRGGMQREGIREEQSCHSLNHQK